MSTEVIDLFNTWIDTLTDDAASLRDAAMADGTPQDAKRLLVGGLSYLLRKIDIVPDYLTGVGVVDDAVILRTAAKLAVEAGLGSLEDGAASRLSELAQSLDAMGDYLGDLEDKLVAYVKDLPGETVRGRTADTVLEDKGVREQFLRELKDELSGYEPKHIEDAERASRELLSFFKAKLNR